MVRLEGRRILVTGAASGMGAAIARLFAGEGASVALLDRNGEGARAVAEGLGAWSTVCDVSDLAQVNRAVAGAVAALGGLDGLVNGAGIYVDQPLAQLDPQTWDRVLGVNLTGPYYVIRAALPALQAAEQASIVNIASISAFRPKSGNSAYSASKAGLIMLTKTLAIELGPKIRVNNICPGFIQTDMTRHIWQAPDSAERVRSRAALGTLGEAEDIARAALFLMTEESRFMTGTEMVVDGGWN